MHQNCAVYRHKIPFSPDSRSCIRHVGDIVDALNREGHWARLVKYEGNHGDPYAIFETSAERISVLPADADYRRIYSREIRPPAI